MKGLIIYAHPFEGSFCYAVKEKVIETLKKNGKEFNLIDLNKDKFDPVMTAEDLKLYSSGGTTDPNVDRYLEMLAETDSIFIIFPVWWGVMPAILKGFFDKVFLPKRAYIYKKSGMLEPLFPQIKQAVIFNTLGGPKIYHNLMLFFPVKKVVADTTLKMIGVKKVKIVQFDRMKKSTDELRAKWLDQVEKSVGKMVK
ncbi:MAG: NAD(P)H-dependent oxidoreductase [bacterium]|jgi:putative NADPH-quinone reductase|nr:NAD(P)H-dependent oxidoreductase [bacterium]